MLFRSFFSSWESNIHLSMIVFLTTLLILLCLAVVLLILIQRTSGGMGSALGGGATDQYLGAGSAAQLSKLTVWAILFFFILSFALYALYQRDAGIENQLLRSGNAIPSLLPSDLSIPEVGSAGLDIEGLPSSEPTDVAPVSVPVEIPETPAAAQPATPGNSSK